MRMDTEAGEAGLLEKALAGDAAARAELVRRHYGAAYSLAWKLTRHVETARDVAQEAFLRAFSRLDAHDPRYGFGSWVLKIASNYALDLLRQAGRREPPPEEVEPPSPEAILERGEDLARVRRALDALPPDTRAALVLHLQEALPLREIAFVLDLSENAVRNRIWRGLQKVRADVREDA
ncbi:MAG TPA: sigma-70 family RNA polymerase sigma factor [Planctomycetota bacterium]